MLPRGWAALTVVAVLTATASAQVSDELGIERFRVAVDRNGIADVEWADVPAHLHWDAGLLVGFAHAPLVLYDRQMNEVDALVERRLSTTLVGAIGLYDRAQLAMSADVVGYQSGFDGDTSPTMKSLPAGGLGDLRMLGKAKLAGVERGGLRYAVAFLATLTVPAGGANGFLREAGVTFAPALAVAVRGGALRGAVNVGYLLRKDTDTAGLSSGDEGFVRAGAAFDVAGAAELFTSISASSPLSDADKNQIAIEVLGGASKQITPTVGAFVAGGVGLDNGFGTPDWRVLAGVRFGSAAPTNNEVGPSIEKRAPPTDRDRDGFADNVDQCPDQPESFDRVMDDDGCPEAPARLEGRVVDGGGRPIPRASLTISIDPDLQPIEMTADEDGWFKLPLKPGVAVIVAGAPEYESATVPVPLEPGTTGKPTITLVRKVRQGQLRGQVLSFNGKPLAATIIVTAKGENPITVTADADGNYTVDLPQGPFQVEITADGYKTQKRNVTVKLDGVTVLNVDLRGAK